MSRHVNLDYTVVQTVAVEVLQDLRQLLSTLLNLSVKKQLRRV